MYLKQMGEDVKTPDLVLLSENEGHKSGASLRFRLISAIQT
jgi:hypothetical protein